MTAILILAAYLFFGLVTVANVARHLELDPRDDSDVALGVAALLFWPIAACFMSLGFAVSLVIKAARGES